MSPYIEDTATSSIHTSLLPAKLGFLGWTPHVRNICAHERALTGNVLRDHTGLDVFRCCHGESSVTHASLLAKLSIASVPIELPQRQTKTVESHYVGKCDKFYHQLK